MNRILLALTVQGIPCNLAAHGSFIPLQSSYRPCEWLLRCYTVRHAWHDCIRFCSEIIVIAAVIIMIIIMVMVVVIAYEIIPMQEKKNPSTKNKNKTKPRSRHRHPTPPSLWWAHGTVKATLPPSPSRPPPPHSPSASPPLSGSTLL